MNIAIIGGINVKRNIKKIEAEYNCRLLIDDGLGCKKKRIYKKMVQESDVIVMRTSGISRLSMETVKDLAKSLNRPLVFTSNMGGFKSVLTLCQEKLAEERGK